MWLNNVPSNCVHLTRIDVIIQFLANEINILVMQFPPNDSVQIKQGWLRQVSKFAVRVIELLLLLY